MAATTLWTDLRCTRCHAMMRQGERVRGSTVANVRHDVCPAAETVRTLPETATERQVAYAMDLQQAAWTPAVFGGRRYSRDELSTMGTNEISRIIDALVSERELQSGY